LSGDNNKEFAERQLDEKFDDIVARLDSTQRSQANIQQTLMFLVQAVEDSKRRQREGRN
jgi:hypothetical protein